MLMSCIVKEMQSNRFFPPPPRPSTPNHSGGGYYTTTGIKKPVSLPAPYTESIAWRDEQTQKGNIIVVMCSVSLIFSHCNRIKIFIYTHF